MPAAAAVEAAPILKEWEEYRLGSTPQRDARSWMRELSLWRVKAVVWKWKSIPSAELRATR